MSKNYVKPGWGGVAKLVAFTGVAAVAISVSVPAFAADASRIGGKDRIDTAINIYDSSQDWSDTIIVTRSDDYADAVAATPLAAIEKAPILQSQSETLNEQVRLKAVAKHVKNAIILGGPAALSPQVEKSFKDSGIMTKRIAGKDRIDTAVQLAGAFSKMVGTGVKTPVFVVTSGQYVDALVAGAAAASVKGVVLLVAPGQGLDPASLEIAKKASEIYTVGGSGAMSLKLSGLQATDQFTGKDRYETSAKVANKFFAQATKAVLASGVNFPDAISGGAYAALVSGPVLLTAPKVLPPSISDYLKTRASSTKVEVIGGESAVDPGVGAVAKSSIPAASSPDPVKPAPSASPTVPAAPEEKSLTFKWDPAPASLKAESKVELTGKVVPKGGAIANGNYSLKAGSPSEPTVTVTCSADSEKTTVTCSFTPTKAEKYTFTEPMYTPGADKTAMTGFTAPDAITVGPKD